MAANWMHLLNSLASASTLPPGARSEQAQGTRGTGLQDTP